MKYNGELDVAFGRTAKSKVWKNTKITWADMVQKLSVEHKTTETFKEYISATKEEQSKIKDVGGYFGGYLRNGRRKPENVVYRQLMTLDIDFAHNDFWELFTMQFENAAVLHATHKHSEESPRYRLVMPLSREATPDEYVAVARKVAGYMDIEIFDNTTFETNRLMFWPSSPKDVDYYFQSQDGPFVDVDEILESYQDWRDSSLWPTSDRKFQEVKTAAKKQEDPENKRGIVGAFCRTYPIREAVNKFLPDVYVSAGEDRYTYTKGTAAAGVVIYDDKFTYSHHGTDPCSGKLCNSFDLVRNHLYGHLDPPNSSTKSFAAMEQLATNDSKVKKVIAKDQLESVQYDFAIEEDITEEDIAWMEDLEIDSKGRYLSTSANINKIFSNDIRLKGRFRYNLFDSKQYIFDSVPWRVIEKPEPVRNVDFSGVRNYVETIYGIAGKLKIEDSLLLEIEKNAYHPVKDYLNSLDWDGESRVDDLLIKYFGAEDSIYTREAMRKMLVGAVGRIFRPGVKFDLVLTLISGEQGTGKSSFFNALGRQWFSDSFSGVSGKEAYEQLQGAWVIEMAELKGLRKAEVEAVKHFITKQEDTFRPAYGRVIETYARQCVFVATTNERDFLRDPTGNRRFLPVDVQPVKLVNNKELMQFLDSPEEVDQVWAEAVKMYEEGETLYLGEDAEFLARKEQREHSVTDERQGLIEDYLNVLLPENWEEKDIFERRDYLTDPLSEKGTQLREFVCVAEIWCECLGKEKTDMDRYKTREINDLLRGLDGWEQSNSTKNFPIYKKQKFYRRNLL